MSWSNDQLEAVLAKGHVRVSKPVAVPVMSCHDDDPPAPKKQRGGARPGSGRKPKPKQPPRRSQVETSMWEQIRDSGLPEPVSSFTGDRRQLHYLEDRKYTADFAWPDRKIALEVDGGAHKTHGRFSQSFERAYLLLLEGWTVLHVGAAEVNSGIAIQWLRNILGRWEFLQGAQR